MTDSSEAAAPAETPAPAAETSPVESAVTAGSQPAVSDAGSHPVTEPQPTTQPTQDARAFAEQIAGGRDIHELLVEQNNRLAALAHENDELKKQGARPSEPAATAPTQPVPPGGATPAPETTAASAAEAAPIPLTEEQFDKRVTEEVLKVPGVSDGIYEHTRLGNVIQETYTALQALGVQPGPGGRLVVPEIDQHINTLTALLDAERAKAVGLPPLEDIDRDRYQVALRNLQDQRRDRLDQYRQAKDYIKDVEARRDQIANGYERLRSEQGDRIYAALQAEAARAQYDANTAARVPVIKAEWDQAFQGLCDALKVSPEDRSDIWEDIRIRGQNALTSEVKGPALRPWMEKNIKAAQERMDRHHRRRFALYAAQKTADATGGTAPASPTTAVPSAQPQQWDRQRHRELFVRGA